MSIQDLKLTIYHMQFTIYNLQIVGLIRSGWVVRQFICVRRCLILLIYNLQFRITRHDQGGLGWYGNLSISGELLICEFTI